MKIRTDKSFNGRRVRLGDTAIVCVERRTLDMSVAGNVRAVRTAHAAHCAGFDGDEPVWCIIGLLDGGYSTTVPATVTGQFVECESDLVPGKWTW